ncbi:MAG: glycosyltransferase [Chloroflexota bacterium]
MRIAYICQSYPPMVSGASIVVGKLAEGMANKGHKVLVCASSDSGEFYESEQKNLKIIRFQSLPNPIHIEKRFLLWPTRRVREEVIKFNPDVVHIHEPVIAGRIGLSCKKSLNVPLILTNHQLPWIVFAFFDFFPSSIRNNLGDVLWGYFSWFLPNCDAVIAPSCTIAEILSKRTACPVSAISNGLDINQFSNRSSDPEEKYNLCKKFNLDPDLPIILHVGRIDKDKQVDLVIAAAAEVLEQVEAQLLVVGDGTKLNSVINIAKTLGISDRCQFPGYVDFDGDLPGLYRIASVFTSASEIETQGMVLLEAAASGLPIVAVDATCIWEILEDGINGFLVPPGNTSEIAEKIKLLLTHPDRAKKMGEKSYQIAQKHAIQNTIEEHELLYASSVEQVKEKNPQYVLHRSLYNKKNLQELD